MSNLRAFWDRVDTFFTVMWKTLRFVAGRGEAIVFLHGVLDYDENGKAKGITTHAVSVGDMRVCHEMAKEQAERIQNDILSRMGGLMKRGENIGVPKEVLDKIKALVAERMGVDPETVRIADTDEMHDGMKVAHVYRSDCPCPGCARGRVEHGEALPEDRQKMN